mmetsp:Transcript_14683/g.14158  ORF Transcript_14683/g.14158 Transcript_14683/m.14158 type:complete len:385 (+) Transcript_14683:76-1230(+)
MSQLQIIVVIYCLTLACWMEEAVSFQCRISPHGNTFLSSLKMAGGMGMGSTTTNKKSKKKGGKGVSSAGSKKNKNTAPFDVSAALIKSEKLYEELNVNLAKELNSEEENADTITSEYIICARINPSSLVTSDVSSKSPPSGSISFSDWVPVAQFCLLRPLTDPTYSGDSSSYMGDERVRMAVSSLCREINFSGSLGAPVLKSIPRNMIQYSAEPLASFYKYVYEDVIQGKSSNKSDSETTMTKLQARTVLQLEEDCSDMAAIKKAYRSLTFDLHPDRFVGVERSEEEKKTASDGLASVKLAYDSLNSGIRETASNKSSNGKVRSWYESLGGKSRTEFYGPIDLLPVNNAKEQLTKEYKCAIASVEPDIVMSFVARNQAAARSYQ